MRLFRAMKSRIALGLLFTTLQFVFVGCLEDHVCPEGWFDCGNERCVAMFWICDGENDCGNLMDEADCDGVPESEICERHQYECRRDKRCIPRTWRCDGHVDCTDGSDELECKDNSTENCDGYQCKDHVCIPGKWKCDGQRDCEDGEDEQDCKIKAECLSVEFECEDGSCIAEYKVCDGSTDCPHGEDEGKHCRERLCKNMTCSHNCHVEPSGAKCSCREGYKLGGDGKSCIDIDECKELGTCSQRCTNSKGSFTCSCLSGYALVGNSSCQAKGAEPLLIFSNSKEVRGMWIRSQRYFPIARSKHQAVGVAMDPTDKRVYWVETRIFGGSVMSCSLDGSDIRPVLSIGLQEPEDVVVDWLARNLYLTDTGLKTVLACKLDGSFCHAVVKDDIDKPRAVVLDPKNGLMYWSDWGRHPGIFRAGMDGTGRKSLVDTNVAWPNGVTLDSTNNRLYWCDGKLERFESIGLDGRDRRIVLQDKVLHPYSLSVFEDTLYWSDWQTFSIDTCHKTTGRNQSLLLRGSGRQIMGIHVYHPVMINEARNPCWSSRCSHLCLLSPDGFRCACPGGFVLDSADKETCLPERSSPFLLAAEEGHVWHIHPESVGEDIVTEIPIGKVTSVGDMAFDWSTNTLYISDVHQKAIFALNTSTYKIRPFINQHLDAVEGLDYDWVGHNLYWVDTSKGLVEVASTKNASSRRILIDHLIRPLDITLLPEKGVMYFVTSGTEPSLTCCDMDGNNCRPLISNLLGLPVAITVDPWQERIFWADARLGTIESADLKGENRKKNQIRVGHVMEVASSEFTLYWTDMDLHMVHYSRHKAALGVLGSIHLPHDHNGSAIIRIVYFSAPPRRRLGPCGTENGGCSHLCLTNPLSYVCSCPTRMELDSSKKACKVSDKPRNCEKGQFRCTKSGECIDANYLCDGATDCGDNSDELDCKPECVSDDFRCDDGQCLLSSWQCDGNKDCDDGSDERNCSVLATCKSSEFSCDGGNCIVMAWKCDGDADCPQGDDEKDCTLAECGILEVKCLQDGRCLPILWRCDGDFDCPDKSDELDCATSSSCGIHEFKCGDGLCLDNRTVCDRNKDCVDGSDEEHCSYEMEKCPEDQFMCNDKTCIYEYELCDIYKDCSDGEDELHCKNFKECRSFEFYCQQSERCIPSVWTCDGMDDCGDNEDEVLPRCHHSASSTTKSTPLAKCATEFGCASGQCIPWSKVCDEVPDCFDRSDEGSHCGTTCEIYNGGCGQKCRDTPMGSVCSCREGFSIMEDGKTCQDVDECLTLGHCSHLCTNIKGGFKCSCFEGYNLTADGRRCKAKDGSAQLLLLLPDRIFSLTVDGHRQKLMVTGTNTDMRSLDVDAKGSTIFWTERKGSIHSLSHAGDYSLVASRLRSPSHLSYDWVAGNLYFSTLSKSIEVCRRDGKYCAKVLSIESIAYSLALAPMEGYIFWSISLDELQESSGQILRAPMDGGKGFGKHIISSKVIWPASLTVDPFINRLYWVDGNKNTLEAADLDGHNHDVLIKKDMHYPFSMAIFEDNVFWADWGSERILRANKFTGGTPFPLHIGDSNAKVMRMMHPATQPTGSNTCLRANCSQLCLLRPMGCSCKCGDGYTLSNFSQNCVRDHGLDVDVYNEHSPIRICAQNFCLNGGSCKETEFGARCQCNENYFGDTCNFMKSDFNTGEQPDYSWVVGMILGSMAVILVLVTMVLLCKRYSRSLRVFGERIESACPNSLFDLVPKSGRLVVDDDEVNAGAESSGTATYKKVSAGGPAFFAKPTYVKNTETGDLYRSNSSSSVDSTFISDNKENQERSLLSSDKQKSVRYMKLI